MTFDLFIDLSLLIFPPLLIGITIGFVVAKLRYNQKESQASDEVV